MSTNRGKATDRLAAITDDMFGFRIDANERDEMLRTAQVYALLDIADAIRDSRLTLTGTDAPPINSKDIARSIRAHLDGEDA